MKVVNIPSTEMMKKTLRGSVSLREMIAAYTPSLRSNGSRERAPDDWLREAIHDAANDSGLLPPCSLSYGGQVVASAPRDDEPKSANARDKPGHDANSQ